MEYYFVIVDPERPADNKAVSAGPDSVMVSWKPPLHSNGVITMYTLYVRDITKASKVRLTDT